MLDDFFELEKRGTDFRREIVAGATTFLTMSYIVVVQPAVLSGRMFGIDAGLDFGAVTTALLFLLALFFGPLIAMVASGVVLLFYLVILHGAKGS